MNEIIPTLVLIFTTHCFLMVQIINPLLRKGLEEEKGRKILYAILQVLYYSLTIIISTRYIWSENYSLFGASSETGSSIVSLQLGWYIYGIVLDRNKTVMLIHHFCTIFLLLYSQYTSAVNFGIAISLLHDVSDPFLNVAKLFNYGKCEILSNIVFALFAIIFLTSRLIGFPYLTWQYVNLFGTTIGFFGLCVLGILHIYWSWLILKIVLQAIRGEPIKDDD